MKKIFLASLMLIFGVLIGCEGSKTSTKKSQTVCLDGGQCIEVEGRSHKITPSDRLPFLKTITELRTDWETVTGKTFYYEEFGINILDIDVMQKQYILSNSSEREAYVDTRTENNDTKILVIPYRYGKGEEITYRELSYSACGGTPIGTMMLASGEPKAAFHAENDVLLFLNLKTLHDSGLIADSLEHQDDICIYHQNFNHGYGPFGLVDIEVSNIMTLNASDIEALLAD